MKTSFELINQESETALLRQLLTNYKIIEHFLIFLYFFFQVNKPRSWNSFFSSSIIWCLLCKKIRLSELNKWININFQIKYFPIFHTSLIFMQTPFSRNYGFFWDRVEQPFYLPNWNEFRGLVIPWLMYRRHHWFR